MLKLRRGFVVSDDPLEVEVEGKRRAAWSDPTLVGEIHEGDEVVVNVEALDLGLGSGGYDIVHVNLTRGLTAEGATDAHVMKLNYTSLQHPFEPIEIPFADEGEPPTGRAGLCPVLVVPLHGHLAPAAWAAAQVRPGLRAGYVQTPGGALPGALSRDVRELRDRDLLAGHVTVAPCYGGEGEAVSLVGALHAGCERLGWKAVIAGPGPGILGSATRYGHGGMAALETAHAAAALGMPLLICPRLSSSDPRSRHRGLSHHTAAVLELLLAPARVPVPEVDVTEWPTGGQEVPDALAELSNVCGERHDIAVEPADLAGYAGSGLPAKVMGRDLGEDPLFFAAALAAGRALGRVSSELAKGADQRERGDGGADR